MRTAAAAGARQVARLILGLVLLQGCSLASDFSVFATSTSAAPASQDGGVLVTTDKLSYELGETIVVRVSNGLDTMITTRDQRFECSIIALEHRRDGSAEWTEVRNCYSGAPPSEVTLAPGSSTTIRLQSSGGPFGALEPGLYRAALDYSRGDRLSLAAGNLLVARSEEFQLEEKGR